MFTPIEQQYIALHPKSAEQTATSKHIFPNGVTHDSRRQEPFPVFVTHALGPHKWDVDGHRITDYRTGHGTGWPRCARSGCCSGSGQGQDLVIGGIDV